MFIICCRRTASPLYRIKTLSDSLAQQEYSSFKEFTFI